MQWCVELSDSARKFLSRVHKKDELRLRGALRDMVYNPYAGYVWKIRGGENIWRRRVGAYWIFFELDEIRRIVSVSGIERRGSNTY